VEMMTSVDLMMATAGLPFFSFSRLTDDVLMRETIWWPPPMLTITSLVTEPRVTATTVPRNWLRALKAMRPPYRPPPPGRRSVRGWQRPDRAFSYRTDGAAAT